MVDYHKRKQGEAPQKRPILSKWLNKIAFVAADYRGLVKILTTPVLSMAFGDRVPPIHRVPNTPKARPFTTRLTSDNIKTTFSHFGYSEVDFDPTHPEEFQSLVDDVEKAAKKSKLATYNYYQLVPLTDLIRLM